MATAALSDARELMIDPSLLLAQLTLLVLQASVSGLAEPPRGVVMSEAAAPISMNEAVRAIAAMGKPAQCRASHRDGLLVVSCDAATPAAQEMHADLANSYTRELSDPSRAMDPNARVLVRVLDHEFILSVHEVRTWFESYSVVPILITRDAPGPREAREGVQAVIGFYRPTGSGQ